ncbi:hypothetical protein Poly30_19800 [Planctomycetes bacterium Poly30]|uniref:Uncharacterized protein n=1 Tax=Saltatorellus ferox TaxID=2528018 RepID=A0A518EQV1_9BACT|nr:hypothetical protein Poly30_19800 [Planctomycetes bacterium Poly30]
MKNHHHHHPLLRWTESVRRQGRAVLGMALAALVLFPFGLTALGVASPGSALALQEGGGLPNPFTNTNAFTPPAPPAPDDVIMLQLRDGTIRWGAIESHGPNSIEIKRLDTSGKAIVPWSMLDPRQAEDLRKQYGYVEVEVNEAYVLGDRLVLEGGGTVDGVIVSREGKSFLVKTEGTLQMVPKSRVRGIESGLQLAALDVYSREELYGLYLAESDPESAESMLQLARKCESILDFVHAAEHYKSALELGLETDRAAVEGMLARAEVKAANQEQVEYLRSVDQLRKRGQFDKAVEKIDAFETVFKGSALIEDARKQRGKLLLARDEAAKELVQRRWPYWAKILTRQKSVEDSFEAARGWASETASSEIQSLVHSDVQAKITQAVTLEEIRKLWEERRRLRYSPASYREDGTWLLGIEAAQKGIDDEGQVERKGPVSEVDAQRVAIEERIKRYMDNQRLARRSASGGQEQDEYQVFWQTYSQGARAGWLLAYYVENGGDFEIRPRPDLRACKTCGGKGAVELLVTGTVRGDQTDGVATCPLCRGVQYSRRIYYR